MPAVTRPEFGDSSHLRRGITPELYRRNAFRIIGLDVDATSGRVRRRADQVRALGRLGSAPPQVGPLPLSPAPRSEEVDDAFGRIRSPATRLIDELFWFWPGPRDADALAALARNEIAVARAHWSATPGDPQARHNLAVLCHTIALDAEHTAAAAADSPDPTGGQDLATLWTQAYEHWLAVWASDSFWSLFALRVARLGHPGFGAATVESFRADLPLVLAAINTMLGAEALEQGRSEAVARLHWQLAARSELPTTARRAALRLGTDPVFARITAECDRAEAVLKTRPDAARARAVGLTLHERTIVGLRTLDLAGSTGADSMHDTVARWLMRAANCYHQALTRETMDWPGVAELVRLAGAVVRGSTTAAPIRLSQVYVDEQLTELERKEKQRQAVARFAVRREVAETEDEPDEVRLRRYQEEARRERLRRAGSFSPPARERPAPQTPPQAQPTTRPQPPAPPPPSQPAKPAPEQPPKPSDSPPAPAVPLDPEPVRVTVAELAATLNEISRGGSLCLYCVEPTGDRKLFTAVKVSRGDERVVLRVPRCRSCAARHTVPSPLIVVPLVISVLGVLFIASALYLVRLFFPVWSAIAVVMLTPWYVRAVLRARKARVRTARVVGAILRDGWKL